MADEDPKARARVAAAACALDEVEAGMAIGLGSGRGVDAVIDAIAGKWPDGPPVRAAVAAPRTEEAARAAGIEVVALDGSFRLDVVIDGADEVGPGLELVKGGGGALLREKLLVSASDRFVVVAEAEKRVERLGERMRLPVEVVRFAWGDTQRRLREMLEESTLREGEDGEPLATDEGHFLLDCVLDSSLALAALEERLKATTGVVEHGLFLDSADAVVLGGTDGGVEILTR
ncbi:MAG: ribose-5-phosphate isomerase RpiA [Thermoleophilaceae bacterium]|nr:ribose-5-phosphate isomerase RpiA [Thermoleophilaceae bacterium]